MVDRDELRTLFERWLAECHTNPAPVDLYASERDIACAYFSQFMAWLEFYSPRASLETEPTLSQKMRAAGFTSRRLLTEQAEETFACLGGCGASVPSADAYCSACFLAERQAQKETPAAPAVPPGHFWRGEPESNRHQCRNCGEHYDKHLHTDEASRCPTANR
jgi:hypothetical protein